ncbi:MAG TPA: C4-type zinc ribbon domain-containing protein [Bryobacteraceae bacterium]|nr:C4-type zinc ribbon domain-containing protein [Bryobacteraceae bacterium]
MIPELHLVIKLQGLDNQIAELEREVSALPKHIAEIEKALDSHIRRLEADRAALVANQKDRKKQESDIQIQDQKISKLKDQMLQAKTNEQYRAFQHEIDFCQAEIRKAEDRILELMSESEPLEANLKKAEAALKEEKQHVDAEKKATVDRTAVDRKQLNELHAERHAVIGGMNQQILKAYERIRKKWHGSVVAESLKGVCSGCRIALRPQFSQDLRRGQDIMFCESCGRFIYYNPPVSFEDEIEAHPVSGAGAA